MSTDLPGLWQAVWLLVTLFVLVLLTARRRDAPRRTLGQRVVHALYWLARFCWCVAKGADKGVLHFHLEWQQIHIQPESDFAQGGR